MEKTSSRTSPSIDIANSNRRSPRPAHDNSGFQFGSNHKLYHLAPSLVREYESIDQDGLNPKMKKIFSNFFYGKYENEGHVKFQAIKIIENNPDLDPQENDVIAMFVIYNMEISWELETEEERSKGINHFWKNIAADAEARRTPIYFSKKDAEPLPHAKTPKQRSPISIVDIEVMETPTPVQMPAKTLYGPITYESDPSSEEEIENKISNEEIVTNMLRAIERALSKIRGIKRDINKPFIASEKAKEALAGIDGALGGLSIQDLIMVEKAIQKEQPYKDLLSIKEGTFFHAR